MTENLTGTDPIEFQDSFLGSFERQTVFMNGLAILALMLVPYTLAQIATLIFVDTAGFINVRVFIVSILVDAMVCALLIHSWFQFKKKLSINDGNGNTYRLMVLCTAALFAASLFHVHSMGSQSSLHHLLIVAILLVVSWFLRWRDVILFFLLGNLALAVIVALEAKGVLSYAPLFVKQKELADVFLDWRFITGQSVNYILVLAACTILIWKLRMTLENSEALLRQTNNALMMEVAERKRSEEEKEELIVKLQESLEQVQTLRGLLPICSHCKKIRNDEGYWMQLESYFRQHAMDIKFTHGICPECAKVFFPDVTVPEKK